MTVGQVMQAIRKEKGLTQKQLAEKCGLATGTIQQYELNKRKLRPEQLEKIANALEVPVFKFVENYENERICKKIGDKIRKLRTEQGLSTNALAELAGVDIITIQNCESGAKIIELDDLKQITTALGGSLIGIVDDWSIYPNRPDDFRWYAGDYNALIASIERKERSKEKQAENAARNAPRFEGSLIDGKVPQFTAPFTSNAPQEAYEALRSLIDKEGISDMEREEVSVQIREILDSFRGLNETGRRKAVERIEELYMIPKYIFDNFPDNIK